MAIRRDIRLRKEFLMKKQMEVKSASKEDRKRKLSEAVEAGKMIPTEFAKDARALMHDAEMDVLGEDGEVADVDDEYATVGLKDPKICVTTSRDPSSRLKQFAKEIKLIMPNSQTINRGNYRIDELVNSCKTADFSDLVVLNETRGMPDAMIICHLPYGPTAYFTLSNCVLRHDIPECTPASQTFPHLIIEGLNSKVGKRVGKILQALYPVAKEDSKRVITFANNNDYISFRHHMFNKDLGKVVLQEAGPRFELRPYEIRLGTLDQDEAEKEWVLRPYMNSSRKTDIL